MSELPLTEQKESQLTVVEEVQDVSAANATSCRIGEMRVLFTERIVDVFDGTRIVSRPHRAAPKHRDT